MTRIFHVRSLDPALYEDERTVLLSAGIIRACRLATDSAVKLRFGSASCEAVVRKAAKPGASPDEELCLHPALGRRLGIRGGCRLSLVYQPSAATLYAGPLVGVLLSRLYSSQEMPFGSMTTFCRELTKAGEEAGVSLFFFSPEEIHTFPDLGGLYYDEEWRKGIFPVPHVIYNRLTSRKYENKPEVQHFLKAVQLRHQTHIFNDKYLDKNAVFSALGSEAALQDCLPESHPFFNYHMLKAMSGRHRTLFIKPASGSLGKGILRLRVQEDGSCEVRFSALSGTVVLPYPDLFEAYSHMAGKIRTQAYQIQEGLDLLTIGGRPVDFRALVQRDGGGEWVLSSIVARIAAEQHFVSNLARGGTMTAVQEALAGTSLASLKGSIQRTLKSTALTVAQAISRNVKGTFGELGVDLALDAAGQVKLLEVNSKPSREEFSLPSAAEEPLVRPSVRRLLDYAVYLSGFM
ncbi:YheC/YheD family protein [Paenibacillus chitinolyticus]|uniref:YheC/YheD family endospore coat-associated protein n=1 Tax=Paenibacillus chitinolyticus TaxID=79263 RepID=UPI002DB6BC9D|nr:YheC/YheD family protein [Paenibacillus chitinolyticus]MEC0246107.1 YheC/YheD family protein [Paenibacillus chitinolyticus]